MFMADDELLEYDYDSMIFFFGSVSDCLENLRALLDQDYENEEQKVISPSDMKDIAPNVLEFKDIPTCKNNRFQDFIREVGLGSGVGFVQYSTLCPESREDALFSFCDALEKKISELKPGAENFIFPGQGIIRNFINRIAFDDDRPSCAHCSSSYDCSDPDKVNAGYFFVEHARP
jgi:hypothetical protein